MAIVRACSRCGRNECANRKGKPGHCLECIDKQFKRVGVHPIGRHESPTAQRNFQCLTCGQAGAVAYNSIRNHNHSACEHCSSRRIYEARLRSEPERWAKTPQEAFSVLREAGYSILERDGKAAVEEAAKVILSKVWDIVDVRCVTCGKSLGEASFTYWPVHGDTVITVHIWTFRISFGSTQNSLRHTAWLGTSTVTPSSPSRSRPSA